MQFTLIAKQDKIEGAALAAMLRAIADTIDRNPNLIKERRESWHVVKRRADLLVSDGGRVSSTAGGRG